MTTHQRTDSRVFLEEGIRLISEDRNLAGFCTSCEGELESEAYYRSGTGWLVAVRCCECDQRLLIEYGPDWGWRQDRPFFEAPRESKAPEGTTEGCAALVRVSDLPKEMLNAVFTKAEIRDMIACQDGLPFVRQNLYRARAKYGRFERLFKIKLSL